MEDDDGAPQHVAEVPNLGRPIKGDNDFAILNKQLRACFVCRLIKTERQARARGLGQHAPRARPLPPTPKRTPPRRANAPRPRPRAAQFSEQGCDNCRFLRMEDDNDAAANLTTPNFTGMMAAITPKTSWASRWERLGARACVCVCVRVRERGLAAACGRRLLCCRLL